MKHERKFYIGAIVILLAVIMVTGFTPGAAAAGGADLDKYDLNGDGALSILDVTVLLNVLDGTVPVSPYSDDLQFSPNADGSGFVVSGIGTCTDKKIMIPPTYKGRPVTGIANIQNTFATEVVIPDSITLIGWYAFCDCTALTNVTIPDGVASIDKGTFMGCTSLSSVTIPESVTTIVDHAFSGCLSLTTVYYRGTSEQWAQISIGSYNDPLNNAAKVFNG